MENGEIVGHHRRCLGTVPKSITSPPLKVRAISSRAIEKRKSNRMQKNDGGSKSPYASIKRRGAEEFP